MKIRFDLQKVSLRNAYKRYMKGEEIYLCPSNLNPYYLEGVFVYSISKEEEDRNFHVFLRSYVWYNCVSNETGKKASFYIKKGGER